MYQKPEQNHACGVSSPRPVVRESVANLVLKGNGQRIGGMMLVLMSLRGGFTPTGNLLIVTPIPVLAVWS